MISNIYATKRTGNQEREPITGNQEREPGTGNQEREPGTGNQELLPWFLRSQFSVLSSQFSVLRFSGSQFFFWHGYCD
jgi:hypothetical protein